MPNGFLPGPMNLAFRKDVFMKDVVIVSACRTAIGAFGGTLKDLNGACLASITMKEAVKRAGIDPPLLMMFATALVWSTMIP